MPKTILSTFSIDEAFVQSLSEECIRPIFEHYFRCEILTPEKVPLRQGLTPPPRIFIANHSGMAFPWDAMMLGYALCKKILEPRENRPLRHMPRSLSAPALSHMPQMEPYFLPGWWHAAGCIDATFQNFDALLSEGYDVIIYPEGIRGIGKGFDKRYRLQWFSTSVVKMSLKHRAPIVPICVINGEFINPFAYSAQWVNELVQMLGIPYLPLGPLTPLVIFPFMFYAGMPAKLFFVFESPVYPWEWIQKKDYAEVSEEEFRHLAFLLRRHTQRLLLKGVKQYGRNAFHFREFIQHLLWKSQGHRRAMFPFLWPDLFLTQWHRYHKGKVDLFHRLLRTLPYWLPVFGWIYLLYQNWPRIRQKARTIRFALKKPRN